MASQGAKAFSSFLLLLNLVMYAAVTVIAGWALNYGIDETPNAVRGLSPPARLFPIYFPIGNMATGFFVIFSLIAGLVGVAASMTGLHDVQQRRASNLLSAGAASITAWALTLLAMGLACKEISISKRPPSLRAMETMTIILSGTQLMVTGAIQSGVTATSKYSYITGRV